MEYENFADMISYVRGGEYGFTEYEEVESDVPDVLVVEGGDDNIDDNISSFLKQFGSTKKLKGGDSALAESESSDELTSPIVIGSFSDDDNDENSDKSEIDDVLDAPLIIGSADDDADDDDDDDSDEFEGVIIENSDDPDDSDDPEVTGGRDESEQFKDTQKILNKYASYIE